MSETIVAPPSVSTEVALPPCCDAGAAPDLRRRLIEVLGSGQAAVVDLHDVERLGTHCVQIMLAARNDAVRGGTLLSFVRASEAARATLEDLGVAFLLEAAAAEGAAAHG